MAELVQQRMEEMLQEVEQMERLGILNASETKAILRRRRGYQYKIQRRIKEKDDFLKYIQYECDVLTLINKRRKDLRSEKGKGYIDQPIKHRINRLFTAACKRFPKQKGSVGAIFTKMLQLHSSKPDIWVVAAKWEMEEMQNMFNTRRLLQRGLRFNPDSQHLWRELRKRREILQVADMQLDDEEASSAVLEGQVAKLVYCKAVQAIPAMKYGCGIGAVVKCPQCKDDVKFKLSFLPVTQLFDFMEDFEDEIVKSAEESHPDSELTWDIKAHRKWAEAEAIWRNKVLDKKHRVARVESIEAECRELYETAVLRIPKCKHFYFVSSVFNDIQSGPKVLYSMLKMLMLFTAFLWRCAILKMCYKIE
ncbi:hypothetical protein CAPTEDRAFT_209621 [Capitella teleta]|uniref:U3 small nucleolar RNA-associated protein 6 N-terminal domain-containing protein n=1 Tax=Capitella teleta TaxID=283909 RepID=R7TA29_CAPTE|nr:hypothetical protein CAPTEDRAFT_209621 [Capitella teleta]|eukprot:ELT90569.1 hypothetical protein CAPTEDRAFT_209621 [Capitella teleta]